ncbi:MAG: GtrA family protein [Candidatus Paralactobacillus gallistercoris]|uniref:GtrA family protein n=1 Tax=Candidatus Paralactobacillus gallistercoris TaxID=2838724 RepID=A0A948X0V1_9LACO|nr:GtrA family protein [Candidatus Paralactobacillus gallistercoris]
MKKIKDLFTKYGEQIRYLFVGGITTVINFVALFVLSKVCHLPLLIANSLAWLISIIWAFFANKSIVYRSKYTTIANFFQELIGFFGARLFSLVLDDGIMLIGVHLLHQNELIVKLIDQVVIVITNYILGKVVFRHKEEELHEKEAEIIADEAALTAKSEEKHN